MLASVYSELGRDQRARDELDRLAADDFADLHVGTEWFFGASLLAGVCAVLGDAARQRLYEALLPYANYNVFAHPDVALGSASRSAFSQRPCRAGMKPAATSSEPWR